MNFLERIATAYRWRLNRLHAALFRRYGLASGRRFIALRWPFPLRKPWQRKAICLRAPGGGVGDELMCTALFREIKRRNPTCEITFLARYPELFVGNPHVHHVLPLTDANAHRAYR